MESNVSFKEIVKKLEEFWCNNGCVWVMPLDTIVGAATYHPTCFFSALSQEIQNYMYVNCCRRLSDGRYGNSHQRLLKHHQFQVTLKKTHHTTELYMDSLRYIGINPDQHDIKFIENDWCTLSLGAFGRGWEVWCDLTEITQFTFFQIIGDVNVPEVTIEFAYGIERLLTIINGKPINECLWDKNITYGQMRQREEKELSILYENYTIYNEIDCKNRLLLAQNLIDDGVFYAAYTTLLDGIFIFNCLDALKRVGQLEHKEFMDNMRSIANQIATKISI